MRTVIRGFLREVYVEFNGDKTGSRDAKVRKDTLERKQGELEVLRKSFEDGKASEDEIEDYNKLSDAVDELKKSLNNTLIVTLIHPGEDGNVEVMKGLSIGNGRTNGVKNKLSEEHFLKTGLFKKIAIGEFGIQVGITDTDKENPFGLFLRRVLSGLFNAVVKSPIDDIGNVLVSNAATVLSSDIGDAIKRKTGDKITLVGVSKVAKFLIDKKGVLKLTNTDDNELADIEFENDQLTLSLRYPGLVLKGGSKSNPAYGLPEAPNGKVVLGLKSDPQALTGECHQSCV